MHTQSEHSNEQSPGSFIAAAAFLFGVAWFLHYIFTDLEQSGGSIRIHIVIAVLYKTLGKWGAVSIFGAAGALALYRGLRGFWQDHSPQEHNIQTQPIAISDHESARLDRWVGLVSSLLRNAPLLLTWLLLVYSAQELLRYSALLPPTLPRSARSFYTFWIMLPFSLPAVFSFVFRTGFIEAVGLLLATAAMTFMSIVVFASNITPSKQFASTSSLVWVPIAQLVWSVALIHLLNKRRNERVA